MTRSKVAILNFSNQDFWKFPEDLYANLCESFNRCEFIQITSALKLKESMSGVETIVTIPMNIPGVKRFKELKNIIILGSTIPLGMRELNLNIFCAKGLNANSVATHSLKLALMALQSQNRNKLGDELSIGIIGTGYVGKSVRKMCENKFASISYLGRSESCEFNIESKNDRINFAKNCDIIFFCIDSNSQTQSYFDAEFLSYCKPNVVYVNVARGDIINEAVLINDLKQNGQKRYYTDVTIPEDYPIDGVLRSIDQVYITNHIAGTYEEAWSDLGVFLKNKLRELY